MALNLRRNALQQNQSPDVDPSRYERICARCGVANPFVNRICGQCGARMAGAPPVTAPDVPTLRSPSQLGGAPPFADDSVDFPDAASNPASGGTTDDEARWTTYWQRASGQTSAPTPPSTLGQAASAAASGRDASPYDYANLAPGAHRRALQRNVIAAVGSWVGVCLLTVMVGLAIFGAAMWKSRHDRQHAQRQALQRAANQRRWAQRAGRSGKSARTLRRNSKIARSRNGRSQMVQTRSARAKPSDIKELLARTPSWKTRLRWITNFWGGFQSRGRDAGQVRPAYTHAVRDRDRKHDRRRLEVRND